MWMLTKTWLILVASLVFAACRFINASRQSGEGGLLCLLELHDRLSQSEEVSSPSSDEFLLCRPVDLVLGSVSPLMYIFDDLPEDRFDDFRKRLILRQDVLISIPGGQILNDKIIIPNHTQIEIIDGDGKLRARKLNGSPRSIGVFNVLVIRVVGRDSEPTFSSNELFNITFSDDISVKNQMKLCSGGKLMITPTRYGVLDVPINMNVTGASHVDVVNAAIARAPALVRESVNDIRDLVDAVMIVVPPGTKGAWAAFGALNGKTTTYNDRWAAYLSGPMHEIGHNLGLLHANRNRVEYEDKTGYMGSAPQTLHYPEKCYNAQNHWHLGWYSDRSLELDDLELPRIARIAAFVDHDLVPTGFYTIVKFGGFYMQYNRAKTFNKDTGAFPDSLAIVQFVTIWGTELVAGLNWLVPYWRIDMDDGTAFAVEVCRTVQGDNTEIPDHLIVSFGRGTTDCSEIRTIPPTPTPSYIPPPNPSPTSMPSIFVPEISAYPTVHTSEAYPSYQPIGHTTYGPSVESFPDARTYPTTTYITREPTHSPHILNSSDNIADDSAHVWKPSSNLTASTTEYSKSNRSRMNLPIASTIAVIGLVVFVCICTCAAWRCKFFSLLKQGRHDEVIRVGDSIVGITAFTSKNDRGISNTSPIEASILSVKRRKAMFLSSESTISTDSSPDSNSREINEAELTSDSSTEMPEVRDIPQPRCKKSLEYKKQVRGDEKWNSFENLCIYSSSSDELVHDDHSKLPFRLSDEIIELFHGPGNNSLASLKSARQLLHESQLPLPAPDSMLILGFSPAPEEVRVEGGIHETAGARPMLNNIIEKSLDDSDLPVPALPSSSLSITHASTYDYLSGCLLPSGGPPEYLHSVTDAGTDRSAFIKFGVSRANDRVAKSKCQTINSDDASFHEKWDRDIETAQSGPMKNLVKKIERVRFY